jgi:hypothetical protein
MGCHMATHIESARALAEMELLVTCEVCDFKAKDPIALVIHTRSVHSIYECAGCSCLTGSPLMFNRHKVAHTAEVKRKIKTHAQSMRKGFSATSKHPDE